MPTKIGRTQYVTATEAATMLGWKLDTFTSKVSRGRAPQPALELLGRRVYKLTDIEKFKKAMPGKGGRSAFTPPPAKKAAKS